jgi:hypothetical protein
VSKSGECAKEELYKVPVDQISAQQQHILEKEMEGLISIALNQEAQILLEHILSWYRDLQLLLLGSDPSHLINLDYVEQLEQAVQRGDFKPMDQVCQAVEETYLALQRSTSFAHSLETLLLKLDRV